MIEINNLTTNPVDEKFFKKTAKIVLERENKKDADLSIALVGPGRIRELNKKYRGKNRVTDVLAFPNKDVTLPPAKGPKRKFGRVEEELESPPEARPLGLGEIVVCLREVKRNAQRYGLTFEKEVSKILIHGILHLLGYDHEKREKEARKMEERQNYYLSLIK